MTTLTTYCDSLPERGSNLACVIVVPYMKLVIFLRLGESFIEQACSAKMARCWLSIYFAFMTRDIAWVWVHEHAKIERNQNRVTLTLT